MQEIETNVNHCANPLTTAPLQNVAAFMTLVERVLHRAPMLPGIGVFYGRSGYGKTFSAIYAAMKYRAYYVQIKSVWTRKRFCQAILQEMGAGALAEGKTIPDMMDIIGDQLSKSERPLIIDESDFLVQKNMIEVVRDMHESSMGTIILIGEEGLPGTLKRFDRVHNRVLDWVNAQPSSMDDTRLLAAIYAKGIEIDDNLLLKIHKETRGCTRRVCVNLDQVREYSMVHGLTKIGTNMYKGEIYTGMPTGRG